MDIRAVSPDSAFVEIFKIINGIFDSTCYTFVVTVAFKHFDRNIMVLQTLNPHSK